MFIHPTLGAVFVEALRAVQSPREMHQVSCLLTSSAALASSSSHLARTIALIKLTQADKKKNQKAQTWRLHLQKRTTVSGHA